MVYGMAWRASHDIWLWPGRQGMGLGIVYGMAWRARNGVWYGLVGTARYMVWPGGHGMVYTMAWRASHGIWYGLADIAWYMVWPGEICHGMWKGIVFML